MIHISTKPSSSSVDSAWLLIFACWLLAATGTLGSLFFSEVMDLKPCVLCWYQRIFMYPLVVIFLVGLFPLDRSVFRYAFPLALIGWIFAVYHYLLYSGYVPQGLQPCGQENSCARISLELLDFITIPMLSILSYTAIIVLLLLFRNGTKACKNGPS